MSRAHVKRLNNFGGNNCGHDPENPRFVIEAKTGKGGFPRIITLAIERLKEYYNDPGKILPSLNYANGKCRQQRSERRESCTCLLMALLKYFDLATYNVGIPTEDGFLNLTIGFFARETGMGLKRVERAMADLKTAGIVEIWQRREKKPDGSWRGFAAVKLISRHLFGALNLGLMLSLEREKALKRAKKKEKDNKHSPAKARFNMLLGGLIDDLDKRSKPKSSESNRNHHQVDSG